MAYSTLSSSSLSGTMEQDRTSLNTVKMEESYLKLSDEDPNYYQNERSNCEGQVMTLNAVDSGFSEKILDKSNVSSSSSSSSESESSSSECSESDNKEDEELGTTNIPKEINLESRMAHALKLSTELMEKVTKFSKILKTDKDLPPQHKIRLRLSNVAGFARALTVNEEQVKRIVEGMKIVNDEGSDDDPHGFDRTIGFTLRKLIRDVNNICQDYFELINKQLKKEKNKAQRGGRRDINNIIPL